MRTLLLIIFAFIYFNGLAQNQGIYLNSLGFLPQSSKKASTIGEAKTFVIKQVNDQKVFFKGKISGPVFQKDVNQKVSVADFSSLTKSGKYFLELSDGVKSIEFEISPKVYNQAFYTSMRGFYLWRCSTEVEGVYNGIHYAHDACHIEDGYEDYQGKPGERRDGTKGL